MINCGKLSGKFTRKVTVNTNDPSHSKEILFCKGQILEAIKLKPKRISFRDASRTAPGQKKTIVITPGDAGPLNLKLAPVESEFFEAELREIEKNLRYELEVTLKTPLPEKAVRTNLKIETGLAQSPSITIPASAMPRPRVVATPRRITVPARRKPDWSQTLRLEWDDDEPHKILSATSSDPGLIVKVIEKDGRQEVVLEAVENYKPIVGSKAITLKTDDMQMQTVRVPVYVSRSRAPQSKKRPPRAARRTKSTPPASLETGKSKARNIEEQRARAREEARKRRNQPAPKPE